MTRFRFTAFCCIALFPLSGSSEDGQWGDLTGCFRYVGKPPLQRMLPIDRDTKTFGNKVADESLVINPDNGGIAHAVVYLMPEARPEQLTIHPSFKDTASSNIELSMHHGRFEPRILLLRTTQSIVLLNRDDVFHNARIDFLANPPAAPVVSEDSKRWRNLREERVPCPVSCSIHPWMRAYVLVRSNPYMASSDTDGRFLIRNLPVGRHTFRLWHERIGYLRDVSVGSRTANSRGQVTITIRRGLNALQDIRLKPTDFDRKD